MFKQINITLVVSCFLFGSSNVYGHDESVRKDIEKRDEPTQKLGSIIFTPPEGWRLADSKILPQSVKAMVVGQGAKNYPPSINLSVEEYPGTLKDYLKIVKSINDSQGFEWKDLGTIRTEAGEASLSQVDAKSQWGIVRTMHVILKKNGTIYILNAASLKEEFPRFYKEFFNAFRSLRFSDTEMEKR